MSATHLEKKIIAVAKTMGPLNPVTRLIMYCGNDHMVRLTMAMYIL